MNVTDRNAMFRIFWLFLMLFSGFWLGEGAGMQSDKNPDVKAWIDSSHKENSYTFSGRFVNHTGTEMSCSYQLKTGRSGRSGMSSSSQSGRFHAIPGKEIHLSTVSVNIQKIDECRIELVVWQKDQVIAGDTLVVSY